MLLTIFTPTFNRKHLLPRLYASLCAQKCKDFEWLVVDDGSTDNTENLISRFITSAPFTVRYIKQANGGKHTAYNTALNHLEGDFMFTVDSDDWLPEDSVSQIKELITNTNCIYNKNFAGIIALKENQEGTLLGNKFTSENKLFSTIELEHKGYGGERSIIFKSTVAKKFPFPVITSEKFMGELVVYDNIAENYKLIVSNKILTTCEYQSTGLSSNFYKLMLNNPGGYMIFHAQRIDIATTFLERFNHIIRYNTFKLFYKGDNSGISYSGRYIALVNILQPISYFMRYYYLKKAKL